MRTLVAAGLAALALAGCGDALEEFRSDLRPLEERAAEQRAEISTELRSAKLGSGRDAGTIRTQLTGLAQTYESIEELDPPGDYEEAFAAYVRANRRIVRDLEGFAAELAAGDAGGLKRETRNVVAAVGESESARLRWLQ